MTMSTRDRGSALVEMLIAMTLVSTVSVVSVSAVVTVGRVDTVARARVERAHTIARLSHLVHRHLRPGNDVDLDDDPSTAATEILTVRRDGGIVATYRSTPADEVGSSTLVVSGVDRPDLVLADVATGDGGVPDAVVDTDGRRLTVLVRFRDGTRIAVSAPRSTP